MENYFLNFLLREDANAQANMNYIDKGDISERVKKSVGTLKENGLLGSVLSPNAESGEIGVNIQKKTIKATEIVTLNGKQQKNVLNNISVGSEIFQQISSNIPEYRAVKIKFTKKDGIYRMWFLPIDDAKTKVAKCAYKDGKLSKIEMAVLGETVNANNQNAQANQNQNSQQQQPQQQQNA